MPKAKTKWAGIEYPEQRFALVIRNPRGDVETWMYASRSAREDDKRNMAAQGWGTALYAFNGLPHRFENIPARYWQRVAGREF